MGEGCLKQRRRWGGGDTGRCEAVRWGEVGWIGGPGAQGVGGSLSHGRFLQRPQATLRPYLLVPGLWVGPFGGASFLSRSLQRGFR